MMQKSVAKCGTLFIIYSIDFVNVVRCVLINVVVEPVGVEKVCVSSPGNNRCK